MADSDDPTTATPSDETQPLPTAPSPPDPTGPGDAPHPPHRPGPPPSGTSNSWRNGQVAVIAVLTLFLGGAVGALVYLVANDDDSDIDAAGEVDPTTTSTTDDDTGEESSTTTSPPRTTTTAEEPAGNQNTGGQSVVGTGIFTASYQSNQDRTTDAFEVGDDWQIRWSIPAGAVTIEVRTASGEVVETIEAEGQAERRFADGGTYRVAIDTDGRQYSLVITDGP